MSEEVRAFFDSVSDKWDGWSKDDLSVIRKLFQPIQIQKGDLVLDVACGTGVVTGLLHELSQAPVTGIDISPKMIDIAKRKYQGQDEIHFICEDFLQFEGGRFDVIVIYNAYPHFLDPEQLCSALKKHLNPGGKFAIVHSLSREKLRSHHDPLGPRISRNLEAPKVEFQHFANSFDLLSAYEDDDCYYLISKLS